MSEYTVTMSFSPARSRILVTAGGTSCCARCCRRSGRSGTTGRRCRSWRRWRCGSIAVRALLCLPDEADATYSLGLTDEIGNPQRSVYYNVEVVAPTGPPPGQAHRPASVTSVTCGS